MFTCACSEVAEFQIYAALGTSMDKMNGLFEKELDVCHFGFI